MIKLIIIKTVLFYFPPVIAICSARLIFLSSVGVRAVYAPAQVQYYLDRYLSK